MFSSNLRTASAPAPIAAVAAPNAADMGESPAVRPVFVFLESRAIFWSRLCWSVYFRDASVDSIRCFSIDFDSFAAAFAAAHEHELTPVTVH
jgi:hypothetical protein